jgi:hypothetical protein
VTSANESIQEKERNMPEKQPPDDESSAPESGTVRDETSGNQPSDRGINPRQANSATEADDPSVAGEEA